MFFYGKALNERTRYETFSSSGSHFFCTWMFQKTLWYSLGDTFCIRKFLEKLYSFFGWISFAKNTFWNNFTTIWMAFPLQKELCKSSENLEFRKWTAKFYGKMNTIIVSHWTQISGSHSIWSSNLNKIIAGVTQNRIKIEVFTPQQFWLLHMPINFMIFNNRIFVMLS